MSVEVLKKLEPISNGIETVIDRVAEILVNEFANQQALAVLGGADPSDYEARVFTSRFEPIDSFRANLIPIINIKESDASTELGATSTSGNNQKLVTIFIDCMAAAKSKQTAQGHDPSDLLASRACRKIANLVRQILKSDINDNLQLDRKLINSVSITSEQFFEPDFNNNAFDSVVAKRLMLQCRIIDRPQINDGVPLDSIVIDITKSDTGEVYTTTEYDYT